MDKKDISVGSEDFPAASAKRCRVLNFGSLNVDHVYRVPHFVQPGETLSARKYERFPGGKGLNQSLALARAGVAVRHAGAIGSDGAFLKELLMADHVDCSCLEEPEDTPTGHAVIQVSATGENCIVLFGGANQAISPDLAKRAVKSMKPGDILLLQNEISLIPEIMRLASAHGLRIFFNPAPMSEAVLDYPLELVDTLIVNETEGAMLAKSAQTDADAVFAALRRRFASLNLLMTLGARGALYAAKHSTDVIFAPACKVEKVVDTTAAGDTFIGYFIAEMLSGKKPFEAMKTAAKASAYCVARAGAAVSIPNRQDLDLR